MVLPETDENQLNSCQTAGLDIFSKGHLLECERYVRGVQRKLDRAVADGNNTRIRGYVHLLSKKSRAVKILVIHRVCEVNSGKYTAGVDGFAMPKDKKERRKLMESLIDEIDIDKKPSPIRRAYIPKPNGDKRPLRIPTIMDRIIQEIIRIAIEPICEYHFLPCSYGFRPNRVWKMTLKHLLRKYPTRNKKWIMRLHMTKVRGDQWILYDRDTDNKLLKMSRIPISRHIKVKSDVRVYDNNATEYWEKRELSKTRKSIFGSPTMERLFVKQKGRCSYCKQLISHEDIQGSATHKHHLRPRSEGGDWKLGNLRLLHSECHTSLHSQLSRKDMSRYISNGIDYLKLLKPQ